MKDPSAGIRHRLAAGSGFDGAHGFARNTVGIAEFEANLVIRAGLEVEEAAREHVRRGVVERLPEHGPLAVEPEQRQTVAPVRLAPLPVHDGDFGVAVIVAFDVPLEAEGDQCRRLDDELARPHRVPPLGGGIRRGQYEERGAKRRRLQVCERGGSGGCRTRAACHRLPPAVNAANDWTIRRGASGAAEAGRSVNGEFRSKKTSLHDPRRG